MQNSQNPFSNTFGIKPKQYVVNDQMNEILDNFSYPEPTERAYMITGVRGSGKTVMLADISEKISEADGWSVINILPGDDMLQSLASKLYSHSLFKGIFLNLKLDVSFLGIGVSAEADGDKFFNLESALERMLAEIKKYNRKILITVDEAEPGSGMERFCLAFQSFIRSEYPVYLIMTGLYNKISDIQKMDKCTFLIRTPKIVLAPLDESEIALSYKNIFSLSKENAIKLARLTKGYAYAYQTLGRLYFKRQKQQSFDDLIEEYKSELIRYSYKTIWSELSLRDTEFVKGLVAINGDGPVKTEELKAKTGFSSSMVNEYKDRLREAGIINPTSKLSRGRYWIILPMFAEFVKDYHMD